MKLTVGKALASATDTTTVLVIRATDDDVSLTCGGVEMTDPGSTPVAASTGEPGRAALLGKRYVDEAGTVEVLCTKGGTHALALDGAALTVKSAKALPSSD